MIGNKKEVLVFGFRGRLAGIWIIHDSTGL
jgi:hypothetical protein